MGLGLRAKGLGFRVQCSRFRVQGLGLRGLYGFRIFWFRNCLIFQGLVGL